MRPLIVAVLVATGAGTSLVEAQPASPATLTLEALETLALEHHPALAEARESVRVAQQASEQAGAWPNPTIGYIGEEIGSGPINRGGEHGIVIEQTLPIAGRLGLDRRVFEAVAAEQDERASTARLRVLLGVRTMYYEVLAGQLRVALRERLARLAGNAVDVSAQLFNVGAADRPDVLASEIEAATINLDLVDARTRLARDWRRLAIAAGQPDLPQQTLAGTLDTPMPSLPYVETLAAAVASSPELATARAALTRAESEHARAAREAAPDLQLRGGPRYNRELLEPNNQPVGLEWAVEVGLQVPLWNRHNAGVGSAAARVLAARHAVRAQELALTDRFERLFQEYQMAETRAETYRSVVLPKAEEAYQLYLARYREMAAAYPQVLIAQRALFDATDVYLDAVERVRTSAIRLSGLVTDDR